VSAQRDAELELVEDIAQYQHDPLGYVLYAFPWGKKGTELEKHPGPRKWQKKFLLILGEKVKAGVSLEKAITQVIQLARASGHGIGKSTLVAWIILWGLSTLEDTRGVVTANTDTQLKTKTWPELGKWYRLAINRHWFVYTATAIYSANESHEKTWRFDAIPWSENNTEAFAGLHNEGRRVVLIFDEASAISDKIWEVAEGALTDENTEIIWLAFGNPTRNTGRFRHCFGRLSHRWDHEQIDSRNVEGTNKAQIEKWIEDYGEDSDFVRVRVTGRFPRASSMQFISSELVANAQKIEARCNLTDPLIMMLDIARGGDDKCVFRFRRGLDARSIKPVKIPGSESRDSMKVVAKAVQLLNHHKPHVFFYDGTGVGGPVGDRIRQLGYDVMEVQFGSASPDPNYANMVTYMWAQMKEWLENGGAIDDDPELETDLTSREFTHDKKDRMILVSKERMKGDGLSSPDDGDSLSMSFSYDVAPLDLHTGHQTDEGHHAGQAEGGGYRGQHVADYDPQI
jgi:hypothetical protein